MFVSDQDDEDGDMYEVPPCERQPVKVPQTQIQENIYLGKKNSAFSLLM